MILIENKNGVIDLDLTKDDIKIVNSDVIIYEKNKMNYNVTIDVVNSNLLYFTYDAFSDMNVERKYNIYENSNVNIIEGYFGSGVIKSEINLLADGAKCDIKTVGISNNSKLNAKIEMYHLSKNTTGINENYAIAKNAEILYDVVGKIDRGMKNSKCSQKTRGIIIEKGSVEADPVLLIDEYDVSANHGACIGKISDEGL